MTNSHLPIHQSVLKKIQQDAVVPTPAWHFVAKEIGIAALWFVSVLAGAVAIAVTLYAINYQRFALFEATHENWRDLLLDTLPWLWFLVLAAGLGLAAYYQKHFRRGYRYPLWLLLSSSAFISVLAGIVLQTYGVGFMIDHTAGEYMPLYASQAKREAQMWQSPMDGRLLGKQLYETVTPTSTIIFVDVAGDRWRTDVSELSEDEQALLVSGKKVRLLGLVNNALVYSFHACGVFPWMADNDMPNKELAAERTAFVRRVYQHNKAQGAGKIVLETVVATPTPATIGTRCSTMPAITRIHYLGE